MARELHEKSRLGFIEVFTDASITVVESRDPKGLYKKARAGEIKGAVAVKEIDVLVFITQGHSDFTGVSAPYEAPESPEIRINTAESDVPECVRIIIEYLSCNEYL